MALSGHARHNAALSVEYSWSLNIDVRWTSFTTNGVPAMPFRFACNGLALLGAFAVCTLLLSAPIARAENEGQDDLDKATDKKLSAESLDDLSQVVDLCESALKKGLDTSNTQFANNLLTGTLLEHANVLTKDIVERKPAPAGWPQLRLLALGDLEKALKVDPQLATAHLMIARLQQLPGGDRKAAVKEAQQAFDLSKDKPETQVSALVLQADLSEDPQKKLDYFNQALKIAPNNQEALRQRGMFLLLTGKVKQAIDDLDAAAKADPENPEIQEVRGLALFMSKRNNEAIDAFSEEIKLMPEAASPYLHRARVYAADKKTKEALDDVQHALKNEPDNPQHVAEALLLRAQVHQQAGDVKTARADLDEVLKEIPDWAPALEFRAILAAQANDYPAAIDDLQALLKKAPQSSDLLNQLALLYQANKQPRKAIATYGDSLASNPESFTALRGRADAYLNVGKHAEAVADYEAALKINPEDSGVLNNLAWVLATSPDDNVRNGKRAIELATQAAKLGDYKQGFVLSTLAAGYAETGDFDTARQWSQKAVDLGSKDPDTNTQLKKELSSYENKKPWREKQVIEESDDSGSFSPAEKNSSAKKLPGPPPVIDKDSAASNDTSTKKD
jgi:tetratricopeptide (TPR) repeat protein